MRSPRWPRSPPSLSRRLPVPRLLCFYLLTSQPPRCGPQVSQRVVRFSGSIIVQSRGQGAYFRSQFPGMGARVKSKADAAWVWVQWAKCPVLLLIFFFVSPPFFFLFFLMRGNLDLMPLCPCCRLVRHRPPLPRAVWEELYTSRPPRPLCSQPEKHISADGRRQLLPVRTERVPAA